MGRRPARCSRFVNNKSDIKTGFCKDASALEIPISDLGNRKATVDDFPLCIHLVSDEDRQLSLQALETAFLNCSKYLSKNCGKDEFHLRLKLHPFHLINNTASYAGADRPQKKMCDAFGTPHGTIAGVNIGQPIFSVRAYDCWRGQVIEALRRAVLKLPGSQKICVSKKWGFTKYEREEFEKLRKKSRAPVEAHKINNNSQFLQTESEVCN